MKVRTLTMVSLSSHAFNYCQCIVGFLNMCILSLYSNCAKNLIFNCSFLQWEWKAKYEKCKGGLDLNKPSVPIVYAKVRVCHSVNPSYKLGMKQFSYSLDEN